MIEKSTTLVIGAGASAEFGLPTGAGLKRIIADLLDIHHRNGHEIVSGDKLILSAFKIIIQKSSNPRQGVNPYLHAAWRIRDAMPQAQSIDNFIDVHQGDDLLETCGKLAIVRSVLEAERASKLYFSFHHGERKPRFDAVEDTWLTAFFRLVTENCRLEKLEERLSTLTLIVFNYDRCIEHYLFHAFQNYYGVSPEDAANLVSRLAIFHPYGQVGTLPWKATQNAIEFGAVPTPQELVVLADQIRTFTEGTDPTTSYIEAIRVKLLQSQIVLFLGFAYHRLNLALLAPGGSSHQYAATVRYFGTALGVSNSDCEVLVKELSSLMRTRASNIALRNEMTCVQLLGEYWRSLSMEKIG